MGQAQAQSPLKSTVQQGTAVATFPPVMSEHIMKLQEKDKVSAACKTAETVANSLRPGLSAAIDLSLLSQEAAQIVESKVRQKLPIGEYEVILVGKLLIINRKIKSPKPMPVAKAKPKEVAGRTTGTHAVRLAQASIAQSNKVNLQQHAPQQAPGILLQTGAIQRQRADSQAQKQVPKHAPIAALQVQPAGHAPKPAALHVQSARHRQGHAVIPASRPQKPSIPASRAKRLQKNPRTIKRKAKKALPEKRVAKKKSKRQASRRTL